MHKQSKLVIFDGNAIMHRAFHAIPPLTTKDGEAINAVYGLISILINIVENLKPTHIIFCFDEKERTFRQDLLATYQSQRPETDHNLISQFQKARDFLESVSIPVYSKSGYEADDVIGTIASTTNMETIIVTGDRDILQLVDDNRDIKLFMPIGGLANGKVFKEKETVERLGVLPDYIPDYKALVGDPSDNYFGISGIGPKTATNLLTKYTTLDNIYEHMSELPERLKAKLLEGKKSAYLSYKLATIVRDVPIKIEIEGSDKWDLISDNVLKLFEEYGFKTLTARIKALGERLEKEKQGNLFI
ncbi:MAG: 5'-3' exonuclease H3TH domain-containing protein [Candidatus Woesebacteria bacterium]|nr:5'-3' exonuclease H3TH domain-containing protein [Candidatus Woesebacteria bacterium]